MSKKVSCILWSFNIVLVILFVFGIITGLQNPSSFHVSFFISGTVLIAYLITFTICRPNTKIDELINNDIIEKNTLSTLFRMIEVGDNYTGTHSSNVANYAYQVAKSMKLSDEVCKNIYIGCKLHDLGKIYIPSGILNKPGKLSDEEFLLLKEHPLKGYQVVSKIPVFESTCVPDIVLYHHERFDGKGYPNGLSNEDIPLEARIVALCDAYDAMTTSRSYRKAMPPEKAIEIIKDNIGTQFDPTCADHFLKCFHISNFKKSKTTSILLKKTS
ncbi:HD-GYP domain-containing protein [Paenibacillus peoriae]|uniref:HD-GYP domain-containing protein n=1 Tax=Paenibacillus peoriae TaxID=59893 RepID=A0A7H0Y2B6_9BACL|nr:HD-GYP domain-containing protein [Paenibacillus peoriae]QNR65224.1 HD-GYP domain-containing protein [Paenibacillus peoriae]